MKTRWAWIERLCYGAPMAASPNDTVVKAGSGGVIVDAAGNRWTIAPANNGSVQVDGLPANYTANVVEIAYVGEIVWHENTSDEWYSWNGAGWIAGQDPLPAKVTIQQQILNLLTEILAAVTPTSARFSVPTRLTLTTKEPIHMATNIIDDEITIIPLTFFNAAGTAVPDPSTGSGVVTVDNTAAFSVALNPSGADVWITPVQPPTDGATGNVTYTFTPATGAPFTPDVLAVVITADDTAVSSGFNLGDITTVPLGTTPS